MSIGSGGVATILVAETNGDRVRGGVSAEGPVPKELQEIFSTGVSASYGNQVLGPLEPVPPAVATAFLAGCAGNEA